ncbi:MAG: peptidase C15 [Geitlerinemataceae cyanobacterium]
MLLTSFDTWLPHQKSNTSDDLLAQVVQFDSFPQSRSLLRKLPVDSRLATHLTIDRLEILQPDAIICCGMAESRQKMMLESQAKRGETVLQTPFDLNRLVANLTTTEISHDAGRFVCNDLYYGILDYINQRQLPIHCLFVHVPVLSDDNLPQLQSDFLSLCQEIDRRFSKYSHPK